MLSRNCPVKQISQYMRGVRTLHYKIKPAEQEVCEIEIPVPWGKIAGKWWGPMNQQPILTVHGWMDNAASFDALIPLLPKNQSFLTIDLPGHGLSDWLPEGMPYSYSSFVILFRRIVEYHGWEKVKIMAHSMSTMFALLHASLFPEETQFVIAIDTIKPPSIEVDTFSKSVAENMTNFLKIERKKSAAPAYEENVLINRWIQGTYNSLDETACKSLMVRGVSRTGDGKVYFHRDPKLRARSVEHGYIHEHLLQIAGRVKCPYMFIKADESPYFEEKKYVMDVVEILKKSCPDFRFHMAAGRHHVHMTNPMEVAEFIIPFLEKYNK